MALKPDWADALVAIGLARLRSGDQDAARKEFNEVLRVSEKLAAELRESGAKDAFSRKEAQAYLRASHALGCLAFDQERYQDALADLERVYGVDEGAVGTEARLIAGAALLKLKRPADAVQVLQVASKSEAGAGRALMSLGLAHFATGDQTSAQAAILEALEANSHFGVALLGRIPARAANLGAATAGSREEAVGYAQTFGDTWDKAAKNFLKEILAGQSADASKGQWRNWPARGVAQVSPKGPDFASPARTARLAAQSDPGAAAACGHGQQFLGPQCGRKPGRPVRGVP